MVGFAQIWSGWEITDSFYLSGFFVFLVALAILVMSRYVKNH